MNGCDEGQIKIPCSKGGTEKDSHLELEIFDKMVAFMTGFKELLNLVAVNGYVGGKMPRWATKYVKARRQGACGVFRKW